MLVLWITLGVLGLLIVLVITLFIAVLTAHNKMFNKRYMPPKIDSYTAEEFELECQRVEINHKGEFIRGYIYTYGEYDKNKIVVFCHGMASTKESYLQEIAYLAHNGLMVLAFDYFGTNESDGYLGGFANSLYSTNIVIDYIKANSNLKDKDIYVCGHSWGGYAALNIVKFHNDIKGIVALAPVVSFKKILRESKKKRNIFVTLLLMLIEEIKYDKFASCDGLNSLKDYNGKILIAQSTNDPEVPFNSSLGYLRDGLGTKAEYIINEDRFHNPDYKKEAVDKLMAFYSEVGKYSGDELVEFMNKQKFREMGELDPEVMDKIVKFVKN